MAYNASRVGYGWRLEMQLEPYHPGKLTQSRRNAGLVTARVTALGALTVGAVAVGRALAPLSPRRALPGAAGGRGRARHGTGVRTIPVPFLAGGCARRPATTPPRTWGPRPPIER